MALSKRNFVVAVMLLLACPIYAQNRVQIGPEIGGGYLVMSGARNYSGFFLRAGITADVPLAPAFNLRTSALFVSRQANIDLFTTYNDEITVDDILVPVEFMYNVCTIRKGRIFVGLGPYISYSLSGTVKHTGQDGSVHQSDMRLGSAADSYMKPFDAGLGCKVGFQLANRLVLHFSMNLGLANRKTFDGPVTTDKDPFGIGIGYMPGKHK